ncbi:thiamine diphosphokinase [Alkaliphilus serpentinus]|uniref:Thiamine diphosphokinase n=1 Tax=Alkaliphilus serpentinus TaxID=1482731 RepID=A0A833HRE8_9FIRM|nr:thiamine diphosphokinase [Alkaliphilus serpentinus]KAB3533131.1 thiamine diphosphokinase [Alkaliphilus serpentinus]
MRVLIIANGEIGDLKFLEELLSNHNYVICADGAAKYLRLLNIKPDILMGDFDSIDERDLQWMKNHHVEIYEYPARKNFTDTELAIDYAMELKPQLITIVGGVGSRWDHSISNMLLLYKILNSGIEGVILNETNRVTITSSFLELDRINGKTLSIIPITSLVKGVTLKGMEYPLNNYDITMGASIGVSNMIKGEKGSIQLSEGVLLVFQSSEED